MVHNLRLFTRRKYLEILCQKKYVAISIKTMGNLDKVGYKIWVFRKYLDFWMFFLKIFCPEILINGLINLHEIFTEWVFVEIFAYYWFRAKWDSNTLFVNYQTKENVHHKICNWSDKHQIKHLYIKKDSRFFFWFHTTYIQSGSIGFAHYFIKKIWPKMFVAKRKKSRSLAGKPSGLMVFHEIFIECVASG